MPEDDGAGEAQQRLSLPRQNLRKVLKNRFSLLGFCAIKRLDGFPVSGRSGKSLAKLIPSLSIRVGHPQRQSLLKYFGQSLSFLMGSNFS